MTDIQIVDLWIREIQPLEDGGQTRWIGVCDSDHLLRRFGSAELVRLDSNAPPRLRLRSVADEVWTLVQGEVVFRWHDLRDGSPSRGRRVDHRARVPTQVFAPFGVAFGVRALTACALLLRVCTHAQAGQDSGDAEELPWGPE